MPFLSIRLFWAELKQYCHMKGEFMNNCKEFWKEEDAVGVVEIVLILAVLVALVLIFKKEVKTIVTNSFKRIKEDKGSIIS